VALDQHKLLVSGPTDGSLGPVAQRQVKMECTLDELSVSVNQIKASVQSVSSDHSALINDISLLSQSLDQKLASFNATIDARIQELNGICAQSCPPSDSVPHVRVDRSMNIVVFGIDEDKDASVWRRKVDSALLHVHGQSVDVADMFRLGRYVPGKTRPVLVKLRSSWDKRIIISRRSSLKGYPGSVYIAADEPLEVRRQKALDRIKSRAERAGNTVSIAGDVLFVNNEPVFSLSRGNIVSNNE